MLQLQLVVFLLGTVQLIPLTTTHDWGYIPGVPLLTTTCGSRGVFYNKIQNTKKIMGLFGYWWNSSSIWWLMTSPLVSGRSTLFQTGHMQRNPFSTVGRTTATQHLWICFKYNNGVLCIVKNKIILHLSHNQCKWQIYGSYWNW